MHRSANHNLQGQRKHKGNLFFGTNKSGQRSDSAERGGGRGNKYGQTNTRKTTQKTPTVTVFLYIAKEKTLQKILCRARKIEVEG